MNFAESIKKARESGLSDEQILSAIKKQNPGKESFFKEKEEKGFSPTAILEEMIGEGKKVETETPTPQNETSPQEGPSSQEDSSLQEDLPPEIKTNIPQKPTEESKIWMRIFITLILVSFTALSFTVVYRAFFIPRLKPISPEMIVKEIHTPRANPPLVKVYPERDSIQRFAISVDEDYLSYLRKFAREEKGGEMVRLIAEDQREGVRTPRITDLEDFFNVFEIDFPENFFDKIEKDFNLFLYTEETPGKLCFAVAFDKELRDDVEWTIMRPWEDTMAESFRNFFSFWDQQIIPDREFSVTTHQGEMPVSFSIRYREGSGNTGIYYTIAEDRLLFGTSPESIKVIIERYYHHD